jgi:ribonucleoside-diphosphate reductase alpha chain
MVGVSFLPHSDHVYKQAPYEALTEQEYARLKGKMPKVIDWSKLAEIEKDDMTDGAKELACAAGGCAIE